LTEDVSFGNFGSKILHAANVIAPIAGTLSGWLSCPTAGGRGLEGAPAFIMERLKGYKVANPIITTQIALANEDAYHLMADASAAITGLIIKEVGDGVGISQAERAGAALMKFGTAALVNGVIAAWVLEAVNNPHGAGTVASSSGNQYAMASYNYSGAYTGGGSNPQVKVDNPQGLAPLYAGTAPDYS
jgi:hypothetical protein